MPRAGLKLGTMQEVLKTNNAVLLNFAEVVLSDAGIASVGQTGMQALHSVHASGRMRAFLTCGSPDIPTDTVR